MIYREILIKLIKIEKAIDTWKDKEDQRVCSSFMKMSYWETLSSRKSL
ncbi:MAG: hypothetical protein ACO3MG_08715 [Saprospiraceae bacterium]